MIFYPTNIKTSTKIGIYLRFLVLCQYKMPGTFTVKAGFALPGQHASPDTGLADPGELEAVEPEYYEDFLPSLASNSLDSSVLAAPEDHWASQRSSRTFTTNLFGSREVGGEGRGLGGAGGGDKGGHSHVVVFILQIRSLER